MVAIAACGGTTPTTPAEPAAYVLTAGAFTLNIFPASAGTDLPTVCTGTNGGTATSMAIPVEVEPEGPGWIARPSSGTLRLTLGAAGAAAYYGPMAGSFTQAGTTVTVGSAGEPAIASAFTLGVSFLSGRIDGDVRYTSADGASQSSCNRNAWSLVRR